jgi:endoglycosylceramidase
MLLGLQTTSLVYSIQINSTTQGFLSTNGTRIVDDQGNNVILRGADFSGYEFGPALLNHYEADYVRMASWGFNVVRLPIAWSYVEPQPGQYDETYFTQRVDLDIKWAKQHGMYVIIDMHQYQWSPHFTYYDTWTAGLPSWAVSNYANTPEGEAQAKADFWNNLGPNGNAPSSTNLGMLDRFKQMWLYVASRYAQEKAVAGYDLFNEPTIYTMNGVVSYDPTKLCTVTLPTFYNAIVDAIRTVDSNHVVFWEPCAIYNMNTIPPSKPNIVYSPHWNKESGYDGNTAQLLISLENNVIARSKGWNQPVFFGEFCIFAESTNAAQYILDFTNFLDSNLIGGAWWTYGRFNFGGSLLDLSGNERAVLVQNLVRPYVQSYSVSVSSSSYNLGTGEFGVDLEGIGIVRVYLSSFYLPSFSLKVDNGSETFSFSQGILTVQISAPASRLTVSPSNGLTVSRR